jgi:hypothetical protein
LSHSIEWITARYQSVPSIMLRVVLADVLHTLDLASDLYTIDILFALGRDGPASALLTMVCLTFAGQVQARCSDALAFRHVARRGQTGGRKRRRVASS